MNEHLDPLPETHLLRFASFKKGRGPQKEMNHLNQPLVFRVKLAVSFKGGYRFL